MGMKIDAKAVEDYLNQISGGFSCCICRQTAWQMDPNPSQEYVRLRCAHCGHIELFDRALVWEKSTMKPGDNAEYESCKSKDDFHGQVKCRFLNKFSIRGIRKFFG